LGGERQKILGGTLVSTDINIDGAERTLSLLGKSMLVAYIGFPLSLVLISWLGSPAGEKGPLDSLILLVTLVSLLALLLCPVLIGVVAAKIGKSGIIWGGLSFLFSPFGQLVGYFKIKSAVDEASSAASRANFDQALSR
jgi:hypothetical protein